MPTQLNDSGLAAFLAELDSESDAGRKQAADYIADLAQQLAPEDTGDLKKSKRVAPGQEPGSWEVRFGDDLPDIRAVAQEYGTPDSAAQPYLTPAVEAIDVGLEVRKRLEALAARCRQ